jgi:hypothetical protein
MKSSASVNISQLNPHNSFPWRLRVLDSRVLEFWLTDWMNEWISEWNPPLVSLLYSPRGWDRTHLLEEFCFSIHSNCSFMYALPRERVYTCYLGKDVFTAIYCNGNMITEPSSSNGRLFRLHYTGFQQLCHNMKMKGIKIILGIYMKENYSNNLDIDQENIVLSTLESLPKIFLSTNKDTTSNHKHIRR